MIEQCVDTMIVASTDKEVVIMTHQNLSFGMCWKLFWATLSLNPMATQVAALIKAGQDNQWIQRERKSTLKEFTH